MDEEHTFLGVQELIREGVRADWHATVSRYTVSAQIPAGTDGFEWNISNIKANKVQKRLGIKGAGTVVANIDSGVQYDHPALVNQYSD